MKNLSPRSFLLRIASGLILILFSVISANSQTLASTEAGNWHEIEWNPAELPDSTNDIFIQHYVIIEKDSVVEIQDLEIGQNGSLEVNGTLIIKGNITMHNNGSEFNMGPEAKVIVYGNFEASNKVNLSVSSYLIIYGDFTKGGAEKQGELDVENGNIYIFGEQNGWGDEFTTCENYQGDTGAIVDEECDYGTQDDYTNNQDDFPEDLKELINCYDLQSLEDTETCEGGIAVFSIEETGLENVTYQWQEKVEEWQDLEGETNSVLEITNVTTELADRDYRVIVNSVDNSSNCRISISDAVSFSFPSVITWTGTVDTDWNKPENWSCNSLPTLETDVFIPVDAENLPVVSPGANALANKLHIENAATVTVIDNWLQIADGISVGGSIFAGQGSVAFVGGEEQIIPESIFENNRLENLLINNPEGVISEGALEITGSVKVERGNFYSGNQLTLISEGEKTAFIDGSGKGEVIGLVSMQRYLEEGYGYKYFSSPFKNSVVGDFAPFMDLDAAFPNFYRYVENRRVGDSIDATGWEAYTDPDGALNRMEGYAVNFGGNYDAVSVELTGEVTNGPVAVDLENNHREYTKGFQLVGNPYPSPIDWEATNGWTKENIDDGIYFFTAGDDVYSGTYTSYVNGVSSDDNKASNIIPSMQGFFVRLSDDPDENKVSAVLGMTNKVRVANFEQQFLRAPEEEQLPLIRLAAGFKGMAGKDAMVLYFEENAGKDFQKKFDAHKILNTDPTVPNLYSLTPGGEELSINAVKHSESENSVFPLGITAEQGGEMSISLADLENISRDLPVYLIDKKNNRVHNLRKGEYHFSIEKGRNNSRFELVFTEVEEINASEKANALFEVFVQQGKLTAALKLQEGRNGVLRISSITGQVLETKKGRGSSQVEFKRISTRGIYFVSLEYQGERYTKKVLIK